jgi:hypothetical protein
MATPAREFALDRHLVERLRFSGLAPENLEDLVSIIVSLKNKYGIVPFAAAAEGQPVPDRLTARYILESMTLNKVMNVLLDTPRLDRVTILPRGIPKSTQFEVNITLGG